MHKVVEFSTNSLVMPLVEHTNVKDFKMFFVEKGGDYNTQYLFEDIFEGEFDFLRVIPLPDFDPNDMTLLDKAIDDYEANPEMFDKNMYEIAKVYH